MGAAARKKQWPWTILRVVVIAQLAYLVIFNAALNLPLTQSLINAVRPEKFQVSWDRAWTWYPFRVYARGIAANGQSRSQQWQVETPAAAASIALLPLVLKRVWISDIVVTDAHYKQRPRLKTDKNYEQALPFFPDIAGREITQAVTTPRPDKRPWHLALNDIEHTKTKVKSPQTNGICERFRKTILQEFYQVTLRKKLYTDLESLQADLDEWITYYNTERTHQGKMCCGRTPLVTLEDGKQIWQEKSIH